MADRMFDDLFPTRPSGGNEPRRSDGQRPANASPHRRTASEVRAASSSANNHGRYRRPDDPQPKRFGKRIACILTGIAALAVLAGGAFLYTQSLPATITLNGENIEVGGSKTLADALDAADIVPKPGDLVAVDGSLIEEGKGEPLHAVINGEATTDASAKLASGDTVELGDGNNIEEPSETVETPIPYAFEEQGRGAIHVIEGEGVDGEKQVKTGAISGIAVEEVLQEPVNAIRRNVSPQVGDDKVIALTFDDGPWPDSTAAVLDVLARHGAKATFFTVGNRIDGAGIDLVQRAAAEGHQVCTHSFDHAAGDGQSVNLGYMTPEDQVAEVQKGYEAIEAATDEEASRVFRAPGGNYGEDVMRNIGSLISVEVGWNIDSQDWRKPGAGPIAEQIKNAWSGSIVLLHDGGGDRTQTVEALEDALPYLKSQGYRFVTMDELLSYPLS